MHVSLACFQLLEPGQEKTLAQTDVVISNSPVVAKLSKTQWDEMRILLSAFEAGAFERGEDCGLHQGDKIAYLTKLPTKE